MPKGFHRARGSWIDRSTQTWVRWTGRPLSGPESAWLLGPVGDPQGIGPDYFDRHAHIQGWEIRKQIPGAGLLPRFEELSGAGFDPARIHPSIRHFYEHTADYQLDAWSQWAGLFKPFGKLVIGIFSRRLEQLNLPIEGLDTSGGVNSEIAQLYDPESGELQLTGWMRTLPTDGRVVYAGSYGIAWPPLEQGPCLKVAFPLPNGNAVVFMRPEALEDGSLRLHSSGGGFGGAGFYFTVQEDGDRVTARYVRSMREVLHVYVDAVGGLHTNHTFTLWGRTFLRLHYRMRPEPARGVSDQGLT